MYVKSILVKLSVYTWILIFACCLLTYQVGSKYAVESEVSGNTDGLTYLFSLITTFSGLYIGGFSLIRMYEITNKEVENIGES